MNIAAAAGADGSVFFLFCFLKLLSLGKFPGNPLLSCTRRRNLLRFAQLPFVAVKYVFAAQWRAENPQKCQLETPVSSVLGFECNNNVCVPAVGRVENPGSRTN